MMKYIKVLLWDLDGTLYKNIPELRDERWKIDVRVVSDILHIPFKEAESRLKEAVHIYKSVTRSMMSLGCGTEIEILHKVEPQIDRTKYLHRDEKLIQLFTSLKSYRHFIFSNILTSCIPPVLNKLGLNPEIFEGFITTEETKTVKPDPRFFQYALNLTKLQPEQHLVVGDRLEVDLLPARKLGMKTCLVWGKSNTVDVSCSSVYKLTNLFPVDDILL